MILQLRKMMVLVNMTKSQFKDVQIQKLIIMMAQQQKMMVHAVMAKLQD